MDEVDGLIVLVEVMDVMVVVLNVNKEIECIWLYVREIKCAFGAAHDVFKGVLSVDNFLAQDEGMFFGGGL